MAKRKTFLLRIDPKLHEAIERWAADEFRSVNAQIEYLLRRSLVAAGRLKAERTEDDQASVPSPDEEAEA